MGTLEPVSLGICGCRCVPQFPHLSNGQQSCHEDSDRHHDNGELTLLLNGTKRASGPEPCQRIFSAFFMLCLGKQTQRGKPASSRITQLARGRAETTPDFSCVCVGLGCKQLATEHEQLTESFLNTPPPAACPLLKQVGADDWFREQG